MASATRAGVKLHASELEMPAAIAEKLPEPLQSSTFTATRCTPLATPYEVPPTVPDTCVPCPLQSVLLPSPTVLVPQVARPPKSLWLVRIPVSMMYAVTFDAVFGYV